MRELLLTAGAEEGQDGQPVIAPENPDIVLPAEPPGDTLPPAAPEQPQEPQEPAAPDAPATDDEPGEETPGSEQQPDTQPQTPDEETEPAADDAEPAEKPENLEQLFEDIQQEAPSGGIPWVGIGIGAGVAAIVIACLVIVLLRRRRANARPKALPRTVELSAPAASHVVPKAAAVSVGKLHEQGARASQQDCFSVSPDELLPTHGLLAVVADGMGGLADGDKVSQTAVTAFMNGFYAVQGEPQQILLALLEQANQAVNDLLGPSGLRKSGSTLVAGLIRDKKFYYVSVGDSRICLYRDGVLRQLNREHIYRNELNLRAVNGEESFLAAAQDPTGGGLTSFLGMGRLAHIDVPAQPELIRPGDKFILMSDGVYNALPAQELEHALSLDAPQAAQAIRAAVQAKGYANQDNYTAVILCCGDAG